jgi:hypothetical protein
MSEGEEFLRDYFKKENITFREQQTIEGLQNDKATHRVADFYLPQFGVFVEYFGQWNIESERERYRIKRKVYLNNQVPCIFLYPENLGIIEYIFPKRMLGVCQKYRMEKSLRKYKWKLMIKDKGFRIFWAAVSVFILVYSYPWKTEKTLLWLGMAGVLSQLYYLQKEYRQLFVSNKTFSNYYFDR